jgi:hypothetical protein
MTRKLMNSKERSKKFESDLKRLLKRHHAEMEIEKQENGRFEILFYLDPIFDEDGEMTHEHTEVNLGSSFGV